MCEIYRTEYIGASVKWDKHYPWWGQRNVEVNLFGKSIVFVHLGHQSAQYFPWFTFPYTSPHSSAWQVTTWTTPSTGRAALRVMFYVQEARFVRDVQHFWVLFRWQWALFLSLAVFCSLTGSGASNYALHRLANATGWRHLSFKTPDALHPHDVDIIWWYHRTLQWLPINTETLMNNSSKVTHTSMSG